MCGKNNMLKQEIIVQERNTNGLLYLLTLILLSTILTASCGSDSKKDPVPPQAAEPVEEKRNWEFVDGNGVQGINRDGTQGALSPRLAVFGDRLFVTWYEWNGTSNQIRVAAYDGASWAFVDGDGIVGLNKNVAQNALTPDIAAVKDKLYVAWSERDTVGRRSQIRVVSYDGSSWTFVDGDGPFGINRDINQDAFFPRVAAWGDKFCVTWSEWNGESNQIRVAVYDGASWWYADGGGVSGINKYPDKDASYPYLVAWNNKLYAAWSEQNGVSRIHVSAFDGNSWSVIDRSGSGGMNKYPSSDASHPHLAVWNNKLYAAWSEWNGSNRIRIAAFDGSLWHFPDGESQKGANFSLFTGASNPQTISYNGSLYAAWNELDAVGSTNQIRVAVFVGFK